MTRIGIITSILVILLGGAVLGAEKFVEVDRELDVPSFVGYKPNEIIVIVTDRFSQMLESKSALSAGGTLSISEFAELEQRFDVERTRKQFIGSSASPTALAAERNLAKNYKVKFGSGTLEEVMAAYEALDVVERVEPIGIHTMFATPNDTYYDNPPPEFPYDQWHYWDTHGVDADLAWDTQAGQSSVKIGILDSGTRYFHIDIGGPSAQWGPDNPYAGGNIFINPNEVPGNGVDDDGNGYVDDVVGYDFVETTGGTGVTCTDQDCGTRDNDPDDGNGHGTHVSGTVGAITNNARQVAGVAGGYSDGTTSGTGNGVEIIPCRIGYRATYFGQDVGLVNMDAAAEAMYYLGGLIDAGHNVTAINCSWGSSNTGGLSGAVDYLLSKDVVIVVAAGNSGANSPSYLSSRGDCFDIAATDQAGNGASFSNYGSWVDVAAPGVEVLSTYRNPDDPDPAAHYISVLDGTSMSAPHVTGIVGLLESCNPALTAADKMNLIANNTDPYNDSRDLGSGIANAKKALDAANCSGCDLVADFSGSPTSGCAPLNVSYTDQSSGTGIDGWSWDFGDGGTSTAQNPSYSYSGPGTYTVTLTVSSSSQGCDDVATKVNYVTVDGSPAAEFTGSPLSGDAPLTVSFTDQSTNATSWSWDFGDGGTSTAQNPSHEYTVAGTYTVTLTATNACGSDINSKVDYITVTEPPQDPPVADFSGSPTSGDEPLTVQFTDLSTNNPTSWSWDFGDGGTSTAQNPQYTYQNAGTYTVSLTATNQYGSDTNTKTGYITVSEPPLATRAYANADISVSSTVGGSYLNTQASDNSYESITEVAYTGHPRKSYSFVEHKWTINVGGGGSSMMFYLEAYRPNNSDGDNFVFAYSIDDATYTNLATVASATEQVYSVSLPAGLTGTVYVRVLDTDQNWGNSSNDAVFIDEMYIEYSSGPVPPVADFVGNPTSGIEPLTVQFTDLSSGDPTSWSWDFGDGGTSTVQSPSYQYASAGTYAVSLTATNAYGSDTETKVDYITVAAAGQSMHVANMSVSRKSAGPNCSGLCDVVIEDANGQPVANATVDVTATGPVGGSYSALTDAAGLATFETGKTRSCTGTWCFEVTSVTHASYTYDPGSNVWTYRCEDGTGFSDGNGAFTSTTLPTDYALAQNYPNPFNPTTSISFTVPEATHVTIEIANVAGQRIAVAADGIYSAGQHTVTWDARNQPSGVYFYKIVADQFTQTRKMILLK